MNPSNTRTDRWFWIAAVVLATAGGIALMIGTARHGMIDLRVYRMGGDVLLDRGSLYDAQLPGTGLPFTYPPFAAIAMIPLALLPWGLAALVWTAISVLCLAAIWLTAIDRQWPGLRRLPRHKAVALLAGITLLSVALEPVRETLLFGQVNLVLTAMILVDLSSSKDRRWRGALVGIAVAVKLTPVLFLALLLITRQWRLLRNALLGLLGAIAVGFAVVPNQSWAYWTKVVRDADRVGGLAFTSNQSVMGFYVRVLGDSDKARPWWFVTSSLIALAVLWVARRYWLGGDRVTAVCVCALAGLYASPVSWSHHWVWALPIGVSLIATVFRRTGSNRIAAVVGVLWYGVLALGPMWWVPNRDDKELHWTFWQALPGNAYLIAGLVALAVFTWAGPAPRRTTVSGERTSEPADAESL